MSLRADSAGTSTATAAKCCHAIRAGLSCCAAPGPLVALRALAALYGVAAERLAACLPACETQASNDHDRPAPTLQTLVSDALGSRALTPTAVHYFHATRLVDPPHVLEHGSRPSQTPGASERGPRGSLVRDVLLRPALYGTHDHLTVPGIVEDLAVAYDTSLGVDLARCRRTATTPCIVEYRRRATRDGDDIDAALWFVAAALRGGVSARALSGHDAHGTPIAVHDIVSVRAIGTQAEWTSEPHHA